MITINIAGKKINKKWFIIIFVVFIVGSTLVSGIFSNKLVEFVVIEAGTKKLVASEFLEDQGQTGIFITDLSKINFNEPGIHEIKIQIGRRTYTSELQIIDTTPPKAQVINQEMWVNERLEADEFIKDIVDATEVKISYKSQPDFSKAGAQDVIILLKDTSGNISEFKALLSIKEDKEPPIIEGVENQVVYIGDTISYKRGVEVTDNRDENTVLEVDSSSVNLKKEGNYKVEYRAIDSSGNKVTKVAEIKVKKKPRNYTNPEEVHQLADNVLDKIIKEEMTDKEKLWEIFKWTNKHITYTGYSDKSDWLQGAALGIKRATGDCFTYYATARELLSRAGFENMTVTRIGGTHYWNLVNYEGEWYHFDTTPYRRGYPNVCFLHTDEQVTEYSKVRKDYYNFDKSKYPATPLEPIKPME